MKHKVSSMSMGQKTYLQSQKRNAVLIQISRFLIFVFFLIVWESCARLGVIDSFIFSSPSQIFYKMADMIRDGSLFQHVSITLAETLISFALVTVLGIAAAILLWIFPRLSAVLEPYLVVLNSLPKSALAPLLLVWLGSNMRTFFISRISGAGFGGVCKVYWGVC